MSVKFKLFIFFIILSSLSFAIFSIFRTNSNLSANISTALSRSSISSSSNLSSSGSLVSQSSTMTTSQPKVTAINLDMTFFGIVFWGRYLYDWAMSSDLKYAYPFSGIASLKTANNNWISQLNCPITDAVVPSSEQEGAEHFNCRPEFLVEAKKYFDVFNFGNTHTDNQDGVIGLNKTRKYLDEAGIQYFGHFDKSVENEICEVVSLMANTQTSLGNQNINYPVALCGYHNTLSLPTDSQLDVIKKYSSKYLTIVYFNQGAEYTDTADGLQRQYAYEFIDRGADLVVGQGSHFVQDTEMYKGKLIVYSLGNFIYDQEHQNDVRYAVSLKVNAQINPTDQLLDTNCIKFKDCLETNNKKPSVNFDFKWQVFDNSNRLTHLADEENTKRILDRVKIKSN